jgi:hypothetical protein
MTVSGSNTSSISVSDSHTIAVQSPGTAGNSTSSASSDFDSVQLSPTAQASAMHQQGMSVQEIADNLGVTAEVVDGYLNIATTSGSGGGGANAGGAKSATASHAVVNTGSQSSASVSSGTTTESKTKTTPIK